MSSIITEIEDLLLAIQIKQSKYKYILSQEKTYNQRSKCLFTNYKITKYHVEMIYDEELDKNKKIKVQDNVVRGKLQELLNFVLEEYQEVVKT